MVRAAVASLVTLSPMEQSRSAKEEQAPAREKYTQAVLMETVSQ